MNNPNPVELSIRRKLAALEPIHLEVLNESGNHNVPAGSESHFKVVLVADVFRGKGLLARHRLVNELLEDELAGPVHALSLNTLSGEEWFDRGGESRRSPECLGGSGSNQRIRPPDSG